MLYQSESIREFLMDERYCPEKYRIESANATKQKGVFMDINGNKATAYGLIAAAEKYHAAGKYFYNIALFRNNKWCRRVFCRGRIKYYFFQR